jgi:hypothetical protein
MKGVLFKMSERTDAASQGQGSGGGSQSGNNQNSNDVGSGSTAQGATNGNTQTGTGQGSQTEADISKHPKFVELSTKLDNVIQDNKKYRDRLRSLVTGEDDDDADSGTQGKGKGKNDATAEILAELRSERAYNRLLTAATSAGFRTPELIMNFVNLDEISDKKGNVTDPAKVVEGLKTKYPDMFRDNVQGGGDGPAGNRNRSGSGSGDMNAMIRRRIRGD